MELIDNVTKTLRDDLTVEIKSASKISMAACCFSIYAFQELKEQLKDIKGVEVYLHFAHVHRRKNRQTTA